MEVFTDCSGHSSDAVNHRSKRVGSSRGRSEKNAIRVCGDWSEQLSSKGKIYFYNCITEVSQWQKPPEWKLPDMDHEELVRHIHARDQLEGRSLKRPRAVSSTHSHLRDLQVDRRSASPKRARYSTDIRSRGVPHERKALASQAETSITHTNYVSSTGASKGCTPRRLNSRPSPRKTYDDRPNAVRCSSQSRRDIGVPTNRLLPTDDMDISPNSSPMSGGSSPTRLHHVQPTGTRRIRPHVTHSAPSDIPKLNVCSAESTVKSSKTSGPLLQLVDALRASLGFFSDPGNSSVPRVGSDRTFGTNGTPLYNRITKANCSNTTPDTGAKYRSPFLNNDGYLTNSHSDSPEGSMVRVTHLRTSNKSLTCESSRPSIPDNKTKGSEGSQRSSSANDQNKNISGLVSTLTALVSLISNNRYLPATNGPGVAIPPSCSTQANYHRAPRPNVTPQRGKQTSSPAIPSPLTPSANTGTTSSGGSSSTRLNTSMTSAYSFPSNQMDDLLSSLENLTQQTRSGPAKLSESYRTRGRKTALLSCNDCHEERSLHTVQESISPEIHHTLWPNLRGGDRCNNATSVENLNEKSYRDSERSHRVERLNDLVKALKSVQQHLNTWAPIPSSRNALNPPSSSLASTRDSEEIVICDSVQDRSDQKYTGESPGSMLTDIPNCHHKAHTNGQMIHDCGKETLSLRSAPGVSPTVADCGASCSHSNPGSAQVLQDAIANPSVSHNSTPNSSNLLTNPHASTAGILEKQTPSPIDRLLDDDCLNRMNKILNSSEAQHLLDPALVTKYMDKTVERLEHEAQVEAKKFDRLQSVLYGELSAESKKLRALMRISEAKLAIHKEKQSALQTLMDAIETRRHLPCLSFSDDAL